MVNENSNNVDRPWVKLGGQLLYVSPGAGGPQGRGMPISADPASDFSAGIKTGPVDYDQRLHAEFIAVDDYSGGQGFDRISVREDIGLYWKSTKGVDTTRSKHIMAPPYSQKVFEQANDFALEARHTRSPIPSSRALLKYSDKLIFGWPGLFITTADGEEYTLIPKSDGTPVKLIGSFTGVEGGATRHYIKFLEDDITTPKLRSFYTTNGTSFTATSSATLWDVFFAQGYFWGLDEDGVSLSTSYPTTGGFNGLPAGYGQFVGPGKTPTGRDGVYFIKGGRLFYAVKAEDFVRTEWDETAQGWVSTYLSPDDLEILKEAMVAPGFNIIGAMYFGTTILLTNGYSMMSYQVSGSQEVPRDIGFQNFRAATPEIRGGMIRAMTADADKAYVGVVTDNDTYILSWNERGWNLMKKIEGFKIHYMDIGHYPVNSWPTTKRSLYVVGEGNVDFGDQLSSFIVPSANGPDTGWTGDFDEVDDGHDGFGNSNPDDDTTYITINTATTRESFECREGNLDRFGPFPRGYYYRPTKIIVHARAKEVGGDATIDLFIRTADTSGNEGLSDSSAHTLTTSYADYESEFIIEPDEQKGWSYTGYKIYIGVLNNSNVEVRVTSMWMEVVWSRVQLQVHELKLPVLSLTPTIGVDEFAYDWDLYTGWMDGGFKDLRGGLYEFLASGDFSSTEYVDVYYMLDGDETEILLGRIDQDGEDLHWGTVTREGVDFRSFRLRFSGVNGVADIDQIDRELEAPLIPEFDGLVHEIESDPLYMVPFGETEKKKKVAQQFIVPSNTYIKRVAVRVGQIWNLDESNPNDFPTYSDNIQVSIVADSSGEPGLSSEVIGTFSGTKLDGTFETLDGFGLDGHGKHQVHTYAGFEADEDGLFVLAGTYWLVVERTGAVSSSVWYGAVAAVDAESDWYASGKAMYYDDDTDEWINVPTAAEMDELVEGFWELEETGAANRLDETIHDHTLTANGAPPAVAGKINNGADLERGSTQRFNQADQAWQTPAGSFAVGLWWNPESGAPASIFQGLISKWDDPGQKAYNLLQIDSGRLRWECSLAGTDTVGGTGTTVVTTGQWYRVWGVFDIDLGLKYLYVNGAAEHTGSFAGPIFASNTDFRIGAMDGNQNHADGIVDQAVFLNFAPAAGFFTEDYNSGSGLSKEAFYNLCYKYGAQGDSDLLFKIGFDRKQAADMEGFVVSYDKRPPFRGQWQLPIDIGAMVDDGIDVEGQRASVENIMNYLEKCWNSTVMLEFEIPDKIVEGGHSLVRKSLVKMSAMPMGFEVDTEAGARMETTVQLLELSHQLSPDEDQ